MSAPPEVAPASAPDTIGAILGAMRGAGCSVEQRSSGFTLTSGDLQSISLVATAITQSGAELLDLWEDGVADNDTTRRYNLLCASGDELLLHRALMDPHDVAPAIDHIIQAALPYQVDMDLRRGESGDDRDGTSGTGVFTIPFGPVRSGVIESMLYQIDTAGEDMLLVRPQVGYKHRGLERRLVAVPLDQAVLVAERIAGMYSVAGAVAVGRAIESIAGIEPSAEASAVRLVLAELERIYNHCDSIMKLTDDASLTVGTAQMGMLKERILRLLAALTGHRFGRGVVVPGGVERGLSAPDLRDQLRRFGDDSSRVRRLLLATDSFLDRLERTGGLSTEIAAALGSSGPVARGSQVARDARSQRPYDLYKTRPVAPVLMSDCDAMARTEVRMAEIRASLRLVVDVIAERSGDLSAPRPATVQLPAGTVGAGWVESPEGEWIVVLESGAEGQLVNARVRPASIANFACLQRACEGWVLTDFAFIEHSFGLSIAGRDR